MSKLLIPFALFIAACGSSDKDAKGVLSLEGEKSFDCHAEKFEYCVREMGLDEATCKKKVAAWCSDSDPGK